MSVTCVDVDTKNWILNPADERAASSGCVMDLERAEYAINWMQSRCWLYEGEKAGQLLDLMPYQQEMMIRLFGWVQWSRQHNRWVRRFRKARMWAPKKNGKPLSITTPIPTPSGWRTMGDIHVGDTVYDGDGQPTLVTGESVVHYNRKCYQINFTDGTHIVSDAEHLWEVEDSRLIVHGNFEESRRVLSTQDLLYEGCRSADGFRWGLPTPSVFSRPQIAIPTRQRCIVAITEVPSVPVKCISVANDRRLFLAGEGMVATHNSPFLAAIELYLGFGEGEQGQKVYTAAKDGDQARIAQNHIVNMVKQSPELAEECKIYQNTLEIKHLPTNSSIRILTSGSSRSQQAKEGLNGSVCFDELHVVDEMLVTRVERAGISRAEPLQLSVSTAGLDKNCYGKREFDYGRRVNSGEMTEADQDMRYLHIEYAVPDDVTEQDFDLDPLKYGLMCNPAMNYIIDPDEYLYDYTQSKSDPAKRAHFMVYRGNRWMDAITRWLDQEQWAACGDDYKLEDFYGQSCCVGLDFGFSMDMSAIVLAFDCSDPDADEEWKRELVRVIPFFFLPEDRAKDLDKNYPFRKWAADQNIILTPEARVARHYVKDKLREIHEKCPITTIYYDPWKADETTQNLVEGEHATKNDLKLEGIGAERVVFKQSMQNFTLPTWNLSEKIRERSVRHPNHPVLSWQASHVEVQVDWNRNIRPVKPENQQYTGKSIDGMVAMIMAVEAIRRQRSSQPRVWF